MRAVLSLGSNLGDSESILRACIAALGDLGEIVAVSSLHRTEPWGPVEQPEFTNAVLILDTKLTPEELLASAQAIESEAGRTRELRWGPRTLDIDLITCDEVVSHDPKLTLPHPRAHERSFVIDPWLEIDPDAVLPGLGRVDAL